MQQSSKRLILPPRPVYVPPWMPHFFGEVGEAEDLRKGKSNSRVEGYHAVTAAGRAPDDTPWCSSLTCWCLEMGGVVSPRNKRADSFANWGVECPFVFGCIVLMYPTDPDAGGSGHVGFGIARVSATEFLLGGGNQSDRASIDYRKLANIRTCRWPVGTPVPPIPALAA